MELHNRLGVHAQQQLAKFISLFFIVFLVCAMLPFVNAQPDYLFTLSKYDTDFSILTPASISNVDHVISTLQPSEGIDGGVEWEIVLQQRIAFPSSFSVQFNSKGLEFLYQPSLTEELDVKAYDFVNATHAITNDTVLIYRPLNVIGSYAAYAIDKWGNQYQTGKVFHVFRPLLIDAKNQKSWATLTIMNNVLTVTVNQTFLSLAEYPVTIDPSFGYTTVGGTVYSIAYNDGSDNTKVMGYRDAPASDGTATAIHFVAYISGTASIGAKACLYKDSDDSLVGSGGTASLALTSSVVFREVTISDAISNGVNYQISYCVDYNGANAVYSRYDSGGSNNAVEIGDNYDSMFYDPISWTSKAETKKWSAYANYTAGGAQEFTYELLETAAVTASLYLGIERILFGSETPATADSYRVLRELAFLPDSTTTVSATLEKALEGGFVIIEISETAATTASIVFVKEILLGLTEITVTVASSSIGKEVTEVLVEIAETLITTAALYFTIETITFTLTDVFGIAALALILALVAFVLVLVKRRNE